MNKFNATDASHVASQLILGASEYIDLLTYTGFEYRIPWTGFTSFDPFALADSRLRLRCILSNPKKIQIAHQTDFRRPTVELLRRSGWEVRMIDLLPMMTCLIVDGTHALTASHSGPKKESPIVLLEGNRTILTLQNHFNALWSGNYDFAYDQPINYEIEKPESKILLVSENSWDYIINKINSDPHLLYDLHPRKFEELIAEMLSREGMEVHLTPSSNDGGRDILAFTDTILGKYLYFVECKRYSQNNPVGVGLVRSLYGTVSADRATAGLLVTTSYFTKGAQKFQQQVQNRISLKDFEALKVWFAAMCSNQPFEK